MQRIVRPAPKEPVPTIESDVPELAKAAFDQLRQALAEGRAALVRCRHRAGGDAWVICGVNLLADGGAELVPMAQLWDNNPDVVGPGE